MPGAAVDAYLYLLSRAFERGEHSFVGNLRGVTDQEWDTVLPGQPFGRSIGWISWHVAAGKHLYWDHAFGDKTLIGDYVEEGVADPRRTLAEVVAMASQWHGQWVERIQAMSDADLEAPTTMHWGQTLSMRRVIAAIIEHDLYHAGEINHLRALLQGTDKAPGA